MVKNPPLVQKMQETQVSIPESGRSPGVGNNDTFSIFSWKIPWTGEPGGLQSRGSQRQT